MATPSSLEQFQLEMVNRARLDPQGEASRLGVSLNAGLPAGTISSAPKQPLAFNELLVDSARGHSDWMLAANIFSHNGQGGSDPGDRMRDAGYRFTGSWTWGENISWRGSTGPVDQTAFTISSHDGLFRSAGHRQNTLNDRFEEIGLAVRNGQFTDGNTYNALMVTQNYAKSGDKLFVTGVAYQDSDGNDFYSPGEGRGGVGVAVGSNSGPDGGTTTYGSGGYQQLVTSGQLLVSFSGGGLARQLAVTVDVGSQNAKVDLIGGDTIASSADATAGQNLVGLELLGIANLDATGNGLANRLVGNRGNNTLIGGGGDDSLEGGAGNDRLEGSAGTDTAIYLGNRGTYQVTENGSGHTVQANSSGERSDTLIGIERIQFADQTIDLGAPPPDPTPPPGGGIVRNGTAGPDHLVGGTGPDVINGLGGNDLLDGLHDNDTLDGGAGRDTAYGGIGDDRIHGGGDPDYVGGGFGNDTLWGGDGNDTVSGYHGNDRLFGGAGNDSLNGGTGTDTAVYSGNRAAYQVTQTSAGVTVEATSGFDGTDSLISVERLAFADQTVDLTAPGTPPPPQPSPGGGVVLNGTSGPDRLIGGLGPDLIDGRGGNDRLEGLHSNDTLKGAGGRDTAYGGIGDDQVYGGDDSDYVGGGFGNDTLWGDNGNDTVSGYHGNDRLFGGAGNDRLLGGNGNDQIDGGPGGDTAVFSARLADYSITRSGSTLEVTAKPGIADGTDRLVDVERLAFSDTTIDAATIDAASATGSGTNSPLAADDLLSGLDGVEDLIEQALAGSGAGGLAPAESPDLDVGAHEAGHFEAELAALAEPDQIDLLGVGIPP